MAGVMRSGLHQDAVGGGGTLKASLEGSRVDSHLHLELFAHILGDSRSEGLLRQSCVCFVKCYLNDRVYPGVHVCVCLLCSSLAFLS